MTDETDPESEIENLTDVPRVLEIIIREQSPIVIINVHAMFAEMFPDGETNGDPGIWGVIMADAIRHLARAHHGALMGFAEEGLGPEPPGQEHVLERLMQVLKDEIEKPTAPITGATYSQDKKLKH